MSDFEKKVLETLKRNLKAVDLSEETVEEVQDDTEEPPLECIDEDGDGYGENCEYGQDCDDTKTLID